MNEDLVKRARKMCDQRPGILRDALEDVALRMADRIEALQAERNAAQSALATFIYETTHLSPEEDDGSHWCKISKECLEAGRRARSNKEPGQ